MIYKSNIHFNPLDPWTPRPIVGTVNKMNQGFRINVQGADSWQGQVFEQVEFYATKQECWDFIARNYPNQIFHWNV